MDISTEKYKMKYNDKYFIITETMNISRKLSVNVEIVNFCNFYNVEYKELSILYTIKIISLIPSSLNRLSKIINRKFDVIKKYDNLNEHTYLVFDNENNVKELSLSHYEYEKTQEYNNLNFIDKL